MWKLIEQTRLILLGAILLLVPTLVDLNIRIGAGPDSKYRLLIYALLLVGVLSLPALLRQRDPLRIDLLSGALGFWIGYLMLRAVFDPHPGFAFEGAMRSSAWAGFALLAAHTCPHPRQFITLIWVALAGQLGPVILAVGNTFDQFIYLQWIKGTDWRWQSELINQERGVVWSSLGNPNYYASYASMLLVWLMAALWLTQRWWLRALGTGYGLVVIYTLIYTQTRGVWVGLLPTGLFIGGLLLLRRVGHPRRVWGWLNQNTTPILLGIVAVMVMTGGAYLIEPADGPLHGLRRRFEHAIEMRDTSSRARPLLWNASIRMWSKAPIFGQGIDRYAARFLQEVHEIAQETDPALVQSVTSQMNTIRSDRTHNDYLQFLAELGVTGLALFLLILILAVFVGSSVCLSMRNSCYEKWVSGKRLDQFVSGTPALQGGVACVVLTAMFCLYDFPLRLPASSLFFGLGLAAILCLTQRPPIMVLPAISRWVLGLALLGFYGLGTPLVLNHLTASHFQTDGQHQLDLITQSGEGQTAEKYKRLLDAERYLKAASERYPGSGEILYDLGRVYSLLYQYENQRDYMNRTIHLLERSKETFCIPETYRFLARSYLALHQANTARSMVETLRIVDPTRDGIENLAGIVDYIAANYEEAENHFKEELRINRDKNEPPNQESLLYLARIYEDQQRYQAAEQMYLQLLELTSGHFDALNRLAELYAAKLDQPLQAKKYYQQALQIAQRYNLNADARRINVRLQDIQRQLNRELETNHD